MLFMVVERFPHGARPVYERAAERGRMLPERVRYVESWVGERLDVCFQLMEAENRGALDEWIGRWADLVAFDVVPVIGTAEAAARALGGEPPD